MLNGDYQAIKKKSPFGGRFYFVGFQKTQVQRQRPEMHKKSQKEKRLKKRALWYSIFNWQESGRPEALQFVIHRKKTQRTH